LPYTPIHPHIHEADKHETVAKRQETIQEEATEIKKSLIVFVITFLYFVLLKNAILLEEVERNAKSPIQHHRAQQSGHDEDAHLA
jgi:uncharacterized membrane protein